MTKEEKELLLKDLSARWTYGVMCDRFGSAREVVGINIKDSKRNIIVSLSNGDYMPSEYCIEEIKPYLRPMESMTEEEKLIYHRHCICFQKDELILYYNTESSYDWLNEHHFDYRGLIVMGLALPAPEGMYK